MSNQPLVGSALVMVQPQFTLLILEATLDLVSSECHQQQRLDRCIRRSVADEVFHFAREQHVPGETRAISWEDANGRWHEELSAGTDRPETDVEG